MIRFAELDARNLISEEESPVVPAAGVIASPEQNIWHGPLDSHHMAAHPAVQAMMQLALTLGGPGAVHVSAIAELAKNPAPRHARSIMFFRSGSSLTLSATDPSSDFKSSSEIYGFRVLRKPKRNRSFSL
jgi:hypothetical protein